MTTELQRAQKRYAHEVAPSICEHRPPSCATASQQQVAYHAARAYGFHLLAEEGNEYAAKAATHVVAHYELASLYWLAACSDVNEIDAWALGIADDLASPHVIVPNIVTMLEWAGISPDEIRPYGGAR